MKKSILLFVMMLVASSVNAQTMNDVFDMAEESKKLVGNTLKKEYDEMEWEMNCKLVEEFANSLRNDGVDVTTFTDADIDRLDAIRISKRGGNDLPFDSKLYNMSSKDFKRAMMLEKEAYLKIKESYGRTYGVKPNSIVRLGGDYYVINGSRILHLENGDVLKIGNVTFICIYTERHHITDNYNGRPTALNIVNDGNGVSKKKKSKVDKTNDDVYFGF